MKPPNAPTEPTYAIFLGEKGYDHELENAKSLLTVGKSYKILDVIHTKERDGYCLEGFLGIFDSVMFRVAEKPKCNFTRGMICAAAQIARQETPSDNHVRMIISMAGGDAAAKEHGDAEDIEILYPTKP